MEESSWHSFCTHSEDDNEEYKVTFSDIKNKLKDYIVKELKSLANVLIDYVSDLTKEMKFLCRIFYILEIEEKVLTTDLA